MDYNTWYSNLSTKDRNEHEAYCKEQMTPDEYAAYTPVVVKKDPLDPKDFQMFQLLVDDRITQEDYIRYKQPRNNEQMIRLGKTLTILNKIKRYKKQAEWISTRIY